MGLVFKFGLHFFFLFVENIDHKRLLGNKKKIIQQLCANSFASFFRLKCWSKDEPHISYVQCIIGPFFIDYFFPKTLMPKTKTIFFFPSL